ncbi:MAG: hypothetical protein ACRD2L_05180, partial [Terriglobia bacterium]
SCAGHDEAFTAAFEQGGDGPPPPERHRQEYELFGFFVTGLASLESFCYAVYAMAVMSRSPRLVFPNPRDIKVSSTANMMAQQFPGIPLTRALTALCTEAAYAEWKEVRNILAHRITPGRQFYLSTGPDQRPAEWLGIGLTDRFTRARRAWLAERLELLVAAAAELAETEF